MRQDRCRHCDRPIERYYADYTKGWKHEGQEGVYCRSTMAEPVEVVPAPNGCQHCGIDKDQHLQRWAPGVRWHQWVEPTDEQRKRRLLDRRNA
ncbi:hypothetical protein [Nocardia sp. NPDC057227]|uniref:hypothetical protein n=1 Tax=Nocardia sp. NPDC057227 TaxID=3346056 RepID=UPI003635D437